MSTCLTCIVYQKCFASKLSQHEMAGIESRLTQKPLKKGDTIFREKTSGKNMYVVLTGNLKAECEDSTGNPVIMRIVQKGEPIGLEAILPGKQYLMTVTATADSTVCIIPVAAVDEVIYTNKEACIMLMEEIKNSVEQLLKYTLVMISGSARSKLAFALLAIAGKDGVITISKEEIARMTGLTRETISRKLALFNSANVIEMSQRNVKITNPNELMKLAENNNDA